jgi:hypothetical protein
MVFGRPSLSWVVVALITKSQSSDPVKFAKAAIDVVRDESYMKNHAGELRSWPERLFVDSGAAQGIRDDAIWTNTRGSGCQHCWGPSFAPEISKISRTHTQLRRQNCQNFPNIGSQCQPELRGSSFEAQRNCKETEICQRGELESWMNSEAGLDGLQKKSIQKRNRDATCAIGEALPLLDIVLQALPKRENFSRGS